MSEHLLIQCPESELYFVIHAITMLPVRHTVGTVLFNQSDCMPSIAIPVYIQNGMSDSGKGCCLQE